MGPVKGNRTKREFSPIFSWFEVWQFFYLEYMKKLRLLFLCIKGGKYQTSNQEKIVKTFTRHCLKHIIMKNGHKDVYFDVMYTS